MMTQMEFDLLMSLKKTLDDDSEIILAHGESWQRKAIAVDTRDIFVFNFRRESLQVSKFSINERYPRNQTILFRLDFGRHTNPPDMDGKSFDGPHIHLYREGFDDKWAFPLSEIGLSETASVEEMVEHVLNYCTVVNMPPIKRSLF